ncbi:hypothetical protein FRC11_001845, partial [Ceratobasidium sp. 423]
MSLSSKPVKSKLRPFFNKPNQPDSHEKNLATVKSSALGTAIQQATPVLGAVGSPIIIGQRPDPSINLPTNSHPEPSEEVPLGIGEPVERPSDEPLAAPTNHIWVTVKLALNELHNCEYPGVLSPLKSAVGALCAFMNSVEMAADNDNEHQKLAASLKRIAESLKRYIEGGPSCDPISGSINQAA